MFHFFFFFKFCYVYFSLSGFCSLDLCNQSVSYYFLFFFKWFSLFRNLCLILRTSFGVLFHFFYIFFSLFIRLFVTLNGLWLSVLSKILFPLFLNFALFYLVFCFMDSSHLLLSIWYLFHDDCLLLFLQVDYEIYSP